MVQRVRAEPDAAAESLFLGEHHSTGSTYYPDTPMLGRLLAEWGPAGGRAPSAHDETLLLLVGLGCLVALAAAVAPTYRSAVCPSVMA
jgi:hypothetical protein